MTLGRGRAPNYALKESTQVFYEGQWITLPEGTFVCPISLKYVPSHILDMKEHRYVDHDRYCFCYTKYGFLSLPRNLIAIV